ncbi:hemerythrin domain-containing protein [Streptomyces sp. NPDC059002]|uniref:hemerythrin domain-containing protein n=1 Tax=Streptomyces sp. NPDC059002 TaxID=3346690 RepID=UPI00369565E0
MTTNPTTAPALHPYTREMVMIHRIFRRESRVMAELVQEVQPGDSGRATVLEEAWHTYATGLHLHHTGEDELLWPQLLARVDLDAEQVLRMEAQHEELSASLDQVELLMESWVPSAPVAQRDALVDALLQHHHTLCAHLDEEERDVMPLVTQHVTEAQWRALGERGLAETPRNRRMIALGAILEDASEDERAEFLGRLPGPARLLWHLVGRRQYRREMRRIRGARGNG